MNGYRFLHWFGLVTWLVAACPLIPAQASPRIDTFDYRGKCLSDRLQETLATSPRDISTVRLPARLASTQVSESDASGKAANAINTLQLIETFYSRELGWTSVDGDSAPMVLLANLAAKMDGSCDGMNAFYMNLAPDSAHIIAILHGHRQATEDLASDIDVVGHEFAHGVFKTTQGEDQLLEKAAINEGVSDMFGVTIRAWKESGEDLANTRVRADSFRLGRTFALVADRYYDAPMHEGAMRDLSNPLPWETADHYDLADERQFREEHAMSGVVSLAFALMVQGGRHPRLDQDIEVQGMGFDKAIRIIFYTLKHRLPFNTMPEFAAAVRRAAGRIHGDDSQEVQSVHNAFAAVGLFDGPAQVPTEPPASHPGAEEPVSQPQSEPSIEEPAEDPTDDTANTETEPASTQPPAQPEPRLGTGQVFVLILAAFLLVLLSAGKILKASRRQQIRRAYQMGQPARMEGVAPPVATPLEEEPAPHASPSGCVAEVTVGDTRVTLMLDSRPTILGRSGHLPLPARLRDRLSEDPFLAREHCELWYQPDSNYLYVRCLSDNGLQMNGQGVAMGDKVKADFSRLVTLLVGRTEITLTRRGTWP